MLNGKEPVEAKLVGSTLVAAFHQSTPSLIWKFDLERNHSFTLALQGEEGDLELGVTSSKGEFYPVARFASREDADQAFTAVQKALMTRQYNWPKIIGSGVAALFGLFFFILIAESIASHLTSHNMQTAVAPSISVPMGGSTASVIQPIQPASPGIMPTPIQQQPAATIQNGVPMSADDVLRPPQ